MTSIGETLRRERLRRNLDLEQISRELKIQSRLLEAIEAEDFDKLPGTVFAKNFVRQYARLLGLDEEEMAAEVQRSLAPPTDLPRFADPAKPTVTPIQVPKVEEWETVGDREFSWGSPLPALALFVVAMLVCSGIYTLYQRKSRPPVLAQNTIAGETAPAPKPAAEQTPAPTQTQPAPDTTTPPAQSPDQPPAATQSATPPVPTASTAPPVTQAPAVVPPVEQADRSTAPPVASGPVHLQITAAEPTWMLARSDGKFLFSGTLDANQSRTVDATRNVELRLGNAAGVNIVLNGKAVGAIGPKGQVRTVQFTSGGFQIVAAPKSPAPLIDPL